MLKHLLLFCSVAIHAAGECCNRIAVVLFCSCINFLVYKFRLIQLIFYAPLLSNGGLGAIKSPEFYFGAFAI
jgi:hypothetical protein